MTNAFPGSAGAKGPVAHVKVGTPADTGALQVTATGAADAITVSFAAPQVRGGPAGTCGLLRHARRGVAGPQGFPPAQALRLLLATLGPHAVPSSLLQQVTSYVYRVWAADGNVARWDVSVPMADVTTIVGSPTRHQFEIALPADTYTPQRWKVAVQYVNAWETVPFSNDAYASTGGREGCRLQLWAAARRAG